MVDSTMDQRIGRAFALLLAAAAEHDYRVTIEIEGPEAPLVRKRMDRVALERVAESLEIGARVVLEGIG